MSRFRKGTLMSVHPASNEVSVKAAIDEFLAHHRRKGSGTRYLTELTSYLVGAGHRTTWLPLQRWCDRQGHGQLQRLTATELQGYLNETQAATSVNVYFKVCAILGMFLRFAVTEGYLRTLPIDVPRPRRLKASIKVFTTVEVTRLAGVVKNENVRDWSIFILLLDTGLRASELCSLRLSDLHLERRELVVRAENAKNKNARIVPISASIPALRKYLTLRGEDTGASETLYLSFYSTPIFAGGPRKAQRRPSAHLRLSTSPLTRVGLYFLVRKWGELANLSESRCSPHTFRHYFATQYLRLGGDIGTLQRILGHSRLDITERYLSLKRDDIQAAHERFSPATLLRASRSQVLRPSD